MEYGNNPDGIELTISSIVLIIYIWGKVWLYYKVEQNPNKENKKGVTNGRIGVWLRDRELLTLLLFYLLILLLIIHN